MTPSYVVQIVTPKKYLLNGLWFGPKYPKRVIIWVHGLGSSMFSKLEMFRLLADKKTAVFSFNNRGHDKIAHVPHVTGVFKKALKGGAAYERFTDCADDIQGAVNFARREGVRNVYLAGHSTGCQKSAYWALKNGRGVKGIILLGPMSDYVALRTEYSEKKIARALVRARALVHAKRGGELLPPDIWDWPWLADAQRFVSLYSGKGAEEIFTYWDPARKAKTKDIRIPMLVLLPGKDEFAGQPMEEIADWFRANIRASGRVVVIPNIGHSFKNGERRAYREIRRFINLR